MLEHLFGSKTRVKILRAFFRDPRAYVYVRELSRMVGSQLNAVRRELGILQNVGLIKEVENGALNEEQSSSGKRKYFCLVNECVFYPELRALLMKTHVLGEQAFVDELKHCGTVTYILLSGTFTETPDAATDILIVGSFDEKKISRVIRRFEQEFGSPIRYTIMTTREFQDRRQFMDRFIYGLLEQKHLVAFDSLTKV